MQSQKPSYCLPKKVDAQGNINELQTPIIHLGLLPHLGSLPVRPALLMMSLNIVCCGNNKQEKMAVTKANKVLKFQTKSQNQNKSQYL